ncbi:MAG: site-specific DNA-methyltransferase [Phycisphaerales bacterium]|nr:site-specific DNA-methyltransferase [Phycisphaerales bacterium]
MKRDAAGGVSGVEVRPVFVIEDGARAEVYIGDSRAVVPSIPECAAGTVDLIFADPPFNWNRAYDKWDDALPEEEYLAFTYAWLDVCVSALSPRGSMWVNIPDDWAAEIVVHLKKAGLHMVNWCIWHYRFGQNTQARFISSKVHALYFARGADRTWNPMEVLEVSDRRSIYFDPRTESKRDGTPAGMRLPMDVWYGRYWGRIQGNNKERMPDHDNQLPEVYLERVVRACSNPGDLVLDPFLGSGTTGVMAHALGRRFIGVEYSDKNAERAAARIGRGPIRRGEGPQSTAIFSARRAGPRARAGNGGAFSEDPESAQGVLPLAGYRVKRPLRARHRSGA